MRLLLVLLAFLPALGGAADLIIGRATEQSSIDPLFSRSGTNYSTSGQMFERLVSNDPNNQLHPALAVSWRAIDPTTWEIKLRDKVKFHDGSDFSAEDVVFSFERARNVPNSPASFAGAVASIVNMRALDRLTVQFKTSQPVPSLIEQVGRAFILSKKAATGLATADFNAGKGMVGTGPYQFVEWLPGQRLVLKRFANYWGPKPDFENVTMKFIPKDASRTAALLAGDVDLIDEVSPDGAKQLKADSRMRVFSIGSTRILYLSLDSDRDVSPFITDAAGKPMDKNPLKDLRVRRALSLMVDRKLITERLLDGSGEPAGQMVPQGMGGYDPTLAPTRQDLAAAKKLLAEAGYPNGFGITLHTSSDRFARDSDLGQTLGQMFSRGGIKVNNVFALPYNVYASAATKREYTAFIFGFGTTTPDSTIGLMNVLATFDKDAGMGAFNRSRYSNPKFDAALKKAMTEFNDAKRNALLQEATRIVFNDVAVVPLYWPVVHWAAKKHIAYEARRDESTLAQKARLAK
ncbi:MAG: ABC transporter substrate-binding protein [Burkholderiales bacterium]